MFVLAQTLLTDNDKVSHLESLFICSSGILHASCILLALDEESCH